MSLNYQAYQTKQFCKVSSYLGSPYPRPGSAQTLFGSIFCAAGNGNRPGPQLFLQVRLLQDDKAIVLELEIIPGQLVAQDRYLFKGPDPFPGNCPVVLVEIFQGRQQNQIRFQLPPQDDKFFQDLLAPGRKFPDRELVPDQASRGDAQGGSGGFPFPDQGIGGRPAGSDLAADENTAW